MDKTTWLKIFAWSLSGLAMVIAILGWGQGIEWELSEVTAYQLFPLFGLIAFGVMWSHYVVSAVRQYLGIEKKELHLYIEITGWIVLFAIVMHPGLLEWQLWRDGFGLPPGSVLQDYVAKSLQWAAMLGMISLLFFLAYELRRWFGDKKWWVVIQYTTDAAMIAIFIHALQLGGQLQEGWLKSVWYFYGVTLVAAMAYIYYRRFTSKQ